MYPEEYKAESIIIREGDVGSTVYVLEGNSFYYYYLIAGNILVLLQLK